MSRPVVSSWVACRMAAPVQCLVTWWRGLSLAKNMLETCWKYLQTCTLRYEVTYPVSCLGFAAGNRMMQYKTQADGHIFRWEETPQLLMTATAAHEASSVELKTKAIRRPAKISQSTSAFFHTMVWYGKQALTHGKQMWNWDADANVMRNGQVD